MKKLIAIVSALLLTFVFVSCGGKAELDKGSLNEDLAKNWLAPNGNLSDTYSNTNLANKNNEEIKGAHIELYLPTDAKSMIKSHAVELSEDAISFGSISTTYASPRQSKLQQLQGTIIQVVEDNLTDISNAVGNQYNVQTVWEKAYDVKEKKDTTQAVFVSYLPLALKYFTSKDAESLTLMTFVLVPVKVEITDYTKNSDGTYNFVGDYAKANTSSLMNWTGDKLGDIK